MEKMCLVWEKTAIESKGSKDMIYRLYLYSTTAEKRQSAAITYANAAIRAVFEKRKLTGRKPMPCMKPFDVDCVIDLIRSELKDPISGTCLCHPIGLSCEEGHYISAATSYELANKVLPKLYTIAEEHDLVLYDGETGRTFYRELIDRAHVALKMRERELKRAILQSMKPVWKFRCIESFRDDHGTGVLLL